MPDAATADGEGTSDPSPRCTPQDPPGEDAQELGLLRQAVAADWRPRDAYERHWAAELVAAMWRQQRLRRLEFAALEAASHENPPTEASLKRLLGFARYGARIDKELAQALRALRVLKGRAEADLAESATCTREPEPKPASVPSPAARTLEPEPWREVATRRPTSAPVAPRATNRHERRRQEALERKALRHAA